MDSVQWRGVKEWFVAQTRVEKLSQALADLEEKDWTIWEVMAPDSQGMYTVICFKWVKGRD